VAALEGGDGGGSGIVDAEEGEGAGLTADDRQAAPNFRAVGGV